MQQKYYYQILIDGKPWNNTKIWNKSSAEVIYNRVKCDRKRHVDYKDEEIELIKIES